MNTEPRFEIVAAVHDIPKADAAQADRDRSSRQALAAAHHETRRANVCFRGDANYRNHNRTSRLLRIRRFVANDIRRTPGQRPDDECALEDRQECCPVELERLRRQLSRTARVTSGEAVSTWDQRQLEQPRNLNAGATSRSLHHFFTKPLQCFPAFIIKISRYG